MRQISVQDFVLFIRINLTEKCTCISPGQHRLRPAGVLAKLTTEEIIIKYLCQSCKSHRPLPAQIYLFIYLKKKGISELIA